MTGPSKAPFVTRESTPPVQKRIGSYPRVRVEGSDRGVVSQAGAVLLVETARKTGLGTAISAALTPWRKPRAVHEPGKVLLDVALTVAGDGMSAAGWMQGLAAFMPSWGTTQSRRGWRQVRGDNPPDHQGAVYLTPDRLTDATCCSPSVSACPT